MLAICRNRDTKVIAQHDSTEAISSRAVRLPRPDFSGLVMTRREGLRMTRDEGAAMTDSGDTKYWRDSKGGTMCQSDP